MPPPSVITIGNFDGVHLGHRCILAHARRAADARSARVVALTFEPAPAAVLNPDAALFRLSTAQEKAALLRGAGADEVLAVEPTPELLAQSPEAFIARLCREHAAVAIVEGDDFRFGRGRAGDVHTLAEMGAAMGFETVVVPARSLALHNQQVVRVSSSLVRWLIGHGRVAEAARCLGGRLYGLTGRVVAGEKRGRTIGVPTANLAPEALDGRAVPAPGVYAGFVGVVGDATYPAAISLGPKPTFGHDRLVLESHLIGFEGDIYGREIVVRFGRWLRDQSPFPGLAALTGQLGRDIETARRLASAGRLEPPAPDPCAPGPLTQGEPVP